MRPPRSSLSTVLYSTAREMQPRMMSARRERQREHWHCEEHFGLSAWPKPPRELHAPSSSVERKKMMEGANLSLCARARWASTQRPGPARWLKLKRARTHRAPSFSRQICLTVGVSSPVSYYRSKNKSGSITPFCQKTGALAIRVFGEVRRGNCEPCPEEGLKSLGRCVSSLVISSSNCCLVCVTFWGPSQGETRWRKTRLRSHADSQGLDRWARLDHCDV